MAVKRKERVVVELSPRDRALLQQIRDELRALGVKEEDLPGAEDTVRRLVEPLVEVSPALAVRITEGDPSDLGQPNRGKANE